MFKLKHFVDIEGSSDLIRDVCQEVEQFVNQDDINVIEITHSFTVSPYRVLSILVSYVEMDEKQAKAITEGVDKAEKAKATKPPKKKTKALNGPRKPKKG